MEQCIQNVRYVKVRCSFVGKRKGMEVWKPGIVSFCYPHFVLVQFEKFRQCFHYDEVKEVDEIEYHRLLSTGDMREALLGNEVSA